MGDPVTLAVIGIAGVAASAAGTAASIDQQKEAVKSQRRAREAQLKIQDIKAQRERVRMLREARIRRAEILQQGVNAGVTVGSSPVQGGASSIGSQLAGNMGAFNAVQQQTATANQALMTAANQQTQASIYGAIGQAAGAVGNQFGSLDFSSPPSNTKLKV